MQKSRATSAFYLGRRLGGKIRHSKESAGSSTAWVALVFGTAESITPLSKVHEASNRTTESSNAAEVTVVRFRRRLRTILCCHTTGSIT